MPKILIFHENEHMRDSFENQIKRLLPEQSIAKVSTIESVLESITENTKLILLNYSWKIVQEDLISSIKAFNNKISVILSTCFWREDITTEIEKQADAILYCPCDLRYVDIIKEHLNS